MTQAKRIAGVLAALTTALNDSNESARDDAMLRVLDEQIAQSEDMFAFGVLERVYDRSLRQIDGVTNRLGVLIAAQAAIEVVLIDKIDEFGYRPGALVFLVIIAAALLFRAGGEADFIEAGAFIEAFAHHPRDTRDELIARLSRVIARNERLARGRQRLFSATLFVTIVALGWAFGAHLLHLTP